jgi:hypothetical protein
MLRTCNAGYVEGTGTDGDDRYKFYDKIGMCVPK